MMTSQTLHLSPATHAQTDAEASLLDHRKFWLVSLFLTSSLGILLGISGLFISFVTVLGEHGSNGRLDVVGPVLIALTFPLLMATAHSMDKIAEQENGLKIEYRKRRGYEEAIQPEVS